MRYFPIPKKWVSENLLNMTTYEVIISKKKSFQGVVSGSSSLKFQGVAPRKFQGVAPWKGIFHVQGVAPWNFRE